MVASLGLRSSSLRMVKDGKTLAPSAYTTTPGKKSRGTEAQVNPAAVYRLFDDGATIVLESLHRYWRPLTDLCRDLELSLGHRLQVNAYITPPKSRGFDVHRDDHDVFVLQVSGAKHWIVYDRDQEDDTLIDEDITPGSALYIPKGFPHAAAAGESASAHLTIGILTHEGIDVIRELVKLAEDEPMFAERLAAAATTDPGTLRNVVSDQLEQMRTWLDKVDIDELTERVARRVMTTAQPILRDQLQQLALLDTIDAGSQIARRRGATCIVFSKDTAVKVLLTDRELEMPRSLESAMQEIARRTHFVVRDLHEFLTPEDSVVLVRRLVREGFLEVVVAG